MGGASQWVGNSRKDWLPSIALGPFLYIGSALGEPPMGCEF